MRKIDDYLIPVSGGEEMKTAQIELAVPAGFVRFAKPETRVVKAGLSFWQRFWGRWSHKARISA